MRESLYTWMRNLVFYYIMLAAVLNFIPENSYRKYIRFFMGMLLMLLLMSPVMEILSLDEKLMDFWSMEELKEAYWESEWNIENNVQDDYLVSGYETEIEEQISNYLENMEIQAVKVDVEVEEKETIEVTKIILHVKMEDNQGKIKQVMENLSQMYGVENIQFEPIVFTD